MYIPEEYVLTGLSIACSSSANPTISSNRSRIRARVEPLQGTVELDVLAAREVGMEARTELEERPDASAGRYLPRGRADDPCDQTKERRLAGAVASDEPTASPGAIETDTSRSAQTSCAPVRPRATRSSLRVCVSRARTTNRRDTPSTSIAPGLHVSPRPRRLRLSPDDSGQRLDEVGLGIAASRSARTEAELGRPVARLEVDVPPDLEMVGDEPDGADEHARDPRSAGP